MVFSDVPLSFVSVISMKAVHVQCRSRAVISGELHLMRFLGNLSAAVPAVCHWWQLELFSMALLLAFISF